MAKRKKGGRRKQKISIAAAAGMVVGIKELWTAYQAGGGQRVMSALTGWNGTDFNWRRATATIPMIGGAAVSMVAAKVGLNRYIRIPWFKI